MDALWRDYSDSCAKLLDATGIRADGTTVDTFGDPIALLEQDGGVTEGDWGDINGRAIEAACEAFREDEGYSPWRQMEAV